MWSPKRIDIGWGDLLAAAARSATSGEAESLASGIEGEWSPEGDALACLSVRSAFDLLLTALNLPPGSEVLVSAVTIGDMPRIVESHGLAAVPVDLNPATMAPRADTLARALSPRSRAVLAAHLFGGRIDLGPIADFARSHDLMLIEDAAQAFAGPDYTGHPASDVSMFSFGPIKTATALGGAIVRVRDQQLRQRMRDIQAGWPAQKRRHFLTRVAKYAVLKGASSRPGYGAVVRACRVLGRDHDRLVNGSIRGFADGDFFSLIRQRPSAPLLSLLRRRLQHFDNRQIADRIERAEQVMGNWRGTALFPGSASVPHAHWLLPICVAHPRHLITTLAAAGYDATQGRSLIAVPPPAGRPDLDPVTARQVLERVVYLPCYSEMTPAAVKRLTRLIAAYRATESSAQLGPACIFGWRRVTMTNIIS
ncbi:MAG TPA: DegT/DnrJ/EryC1/StrS family aminotransferase [Pirellulales bacterium]|jgi:dTDP-4-amino-4,6-dideoxygalactose transaminase|nr:DegT/DnrJ/EryC1/StrS family aminotransferase [Pirellulales bacterium]